MTEHERDELEEARHQELIEQGAKIEKAIQDSREKSSQEHGSIITRVDTQGDATRAHMASEVGVVSKEMRFFKNFMDRMRLAMKRWMERHGMRSDDLDE